MPKSTTSPGRNLRYMAAIADARTTAAKLAPEQIDSMLADQRQIASLDQTIVDSIDPELSRLQFIRCHKSGRICNILPMHDIRHMVNAIGRERTISRLSMQYRVACHPYWLHTGYDAIRENQRIDPAGTFVFLFGKLIGWDAGSRHANYDWQLASQHRGELFDRLEWFTESRVTIAATELMRRLMALASTNNCRRHLPNIDGSLRSILHDDDTRAAISAFADTLAGAIGNIVESHLRKKWSRYKQTHQRLTTADLREITVDLGGNSAMRSEETYESDMMRAIRELDFPTGPRRVIGISDSERNGQATKPHPLGWTTAPTITKGKPVAINPPQAPRCTAVPPVASQPAPKPAASTGISLASLIGKPQENGND